MSDNKSVLEKSFSEIGVKPVGRQTIYGRDILFGDGFVTGGRETDPYRKLQKFGIEKGEYPNGCYVTCWLWASDDQKVGLGLPIFFDPMHDITQTLDWRRERRLDEAKMSAVHTIRSLKDMQKSPQNAH